MKRKQFLLQILSLSMSFLVSCGASSSSEEGNATLDTSLSTSSNEETNTTSESKYSVEENFSYWKKGRDNLFAYNGDYTTSIFKTECEPDKPDQFINTKESRSGNKLYREDSINRNGANIRNIVVLKNVECEDGKTRMKYYKETNNDGTITKEGKYVSPNYVEENHFAYYFPAASMEDSCFEHGDTYEEVVANAKKEFKEEFYADASKLEFTRNSENSVTFSLSGSFIYVDEDAKKDEEGYVKDVREVEIGSKVDGEYLTSIYMIVKVKRVYKDKELVFSDDIKIDIAYTFDQEYYDSINIETENTPNEYRRKINFHVDGYPFIWSIEDSYAENELAIDEVNNYLKTETNFISSTSITNDEKLNLFKVYADKDMTVPFVNTNLDKIDLYAKLTPTENRGLILVLLDYNETIRVDMVYTREIGGTFDTAKTMEYCSLVSIDGENVKEGEKPILTISESKVYTVLYRQ